MNKFYSNKLKKKLCTEVIVHGQSTIKTAEANGIPLKTFEKWITAFNKDPHCFDLDNIFDDTSFKLIDTPKPIDIYDNMSNNELKIILMKKDIEIERLKKGYTVRGGGMEKKEFVIFNKKNTK